MTPAAPEERWERAAAWLAVAAMCALSAWWRWRFLDGSPYPMGVDGYFYAGQLRSLLEHGALAWPASPLTFWLMAPLAALSDPIVGAKLGAAILGALAGVPAHALGRRLGGSSAAGLAACAILTTSAGSFYLSIEFVKQGVGVTVALVALVALARALERPTRARVAALVAATLATWLTHKTAAALVAVVAVPAVIAELRARGLVDRRRVGLAALVAVAAVALLVVLGLIFPARFLGLRDLGLIAGLFGGRARWELPALDLGTRALAIGHEALLGGAAALAFAVVQIAIRVRRGALPGRPAERAMAIALAALAVVIALPWLDVADPQGLGFRLRLTAFVPLALVAAAVVGVGFARMPPVAVAGRARLALGLALAAAVFAAQPATRDEGVVRAHPALVAAVRALDGVVPRGDVVIATERHIAFMAAWYAHVAVSLEPGRVPRAHRWRLLPLFFIGDGSALDHALLDARAQPHLTPPRGLHPSNADGLVLVAEPTWEWVLAQLPAKDRAWAQAWHTI